MSRHKLVCGEAAYARVTTLCHDHDLRIEQVVEMGTELARIALKVQQGGGGLFAVYHGRLIEVTVHV